jgi:hypothetical protein
MALTSGVASPEKYRACPDRGAAANEKINPDHAFRDSELGWLR